MLERKKKCMKIECVLMIMPVKSGRFMRYTQFYIFWQLDSFERCLLLFNFVIFYKMQTTNF